jgi:hypothetical protein
LADDAAHAGMRGERRVGLDVTKIQRRARLTFYFFDDAKAFID